MKRTPLYDSHVELGGRMVEFAGWSMPIQYPTGINEEHLAVRTGVGIFDVSHMGQARIRGAGAEEFLRYAATNDAARLRPGRAHYTMLLNDRGGVVDDVYLYRDADDDFLMVSNAANHARVLEHLRSIARGYDCSVEDESDRWAVMALQGPGAALLLERRADQDLSGVRKNTTVPGRVAGRDVRLTRTGYTGEDGFEIFAAPEAAVAVWEDLVGAGAIPCGLGARDTLRLEAGFPLYGHELTESTNPLCTPFRWVVKDKGFHGREAIWGAPCPRVLVGLKLSQRGIPRQGYRLLQGEQAVGEVTSGTISPVTREAIALAWLDRRLATPGQAVSVEIRGQPVPATVVEPPFTTG